MQRHGCFGVPSVFSFDSKFCAGCCDFDECQRTCHAALVRIDPDLVRDLLAKHRNFRDGYEPQAPINKAPTPARHKRVKGAEIELSDSQLQQVEALPKKVGDYLRKLYKRGIEQIIDSALSVGENPFAEDGYRVYHLAFECLKKGCVSRGYLTAAFQQELGWSRASASSQTTIVWAVLKALGLGYEDGAYLAPSPRMPCENRQKKLFWRSECQ